MSGTKSRSPEMNGTEVPSFDTDTSYWSRAGRDLNLDRATMHVTHDAFILVYVEGSLVLSTIGAGRVVDISGTIYHQHLLG